MENKDFLMIMDRLSFLSDKVEIACSQLNEHAEPYQSVEGKELYIPRGIVVLNGSETISNVAVGLLCLV